MLVNADPIETDLVGVAELVNVLGVILVALGGVEVFIGQIDPSRVVLLGEIVRQVPVGHQVEERDFHGRLPRRHVGRRNRMSGF